MLTEDMARTSSDARLVVAQSHHHTGSKTPKTIRQASHITLSLSDSRTQILQILEIRILIIILTHMDSKVAWSPDAALLETMLATPEGGVFLWELHAERLATSAATLGFGCPDRSMLLQQVTAISASHPAPGRLRLLLRRDGSVVIERSELPASGPTASCLGVQSRRGSFQAPDLVPSKVLILKARSEWSTHSNR